MRITISTSSYNDRRMGKPWIARVDFSDPKGAFEFGQWIGASGEAGELAVDADPGDIVAEGQKDFRKPSNSSPTYRVVRPDGTLGDSVSKLDAYKAWQAKHAPAVAPAAPVSPAPIDLSAVPTEDLVAELRRRGVA